MDIAYSAPSSGVFLGSPAILVVDGGSRLLSSHDTFYRGGTTYVLESLDGGLNWTQIGVVNGQYWSSLCEYEGEAVALLSPPGDALPGRCCNAASMSVGNKIP